MIAYWSGYELGNPLSSVKDQPFGIVILTQAYFYSKTYAADIYGACAWSLNVAVKECPSNNTAGTDCGSRSWVSPPPGCCAKDIVQQIGPNCPGTPSCDNQCTHCSYVPEPASCCFSPSGIDTRFLTLRHTLADIRSDVKVLQAAQKKVMISVFDRMQYPGGSASITFADIDPGAASRNLAAFVNDMGLDGVDFNFEFIDCPDARASTCHWVDIVQRTRGLLPDKLIAFTAYPGSGGNTLGVLREVSQAIDFAQEDSYGGASPFFVQMKGVVGERRVYYGVEADLPRTPLSQVRGLAASWNSSGAAGLFLWTANRDISRATSCLDPVNGGSADHPSDWAYTKSMWSGMFPPGLARLLV